MGASSIRYAYAGWRVLAEYENGGSNPKRHFVYGIGLDEPLIMDVNEDNDEYTTEGVDSRYFYHQNTLGSVYGISDDSGNIIEAYEYDPYGKYWVITDGDDGDSIVNFTSNDVRTTQGLSNYGNPYLFTGRRWDDESKLQYSRYRYYDPILGRFISRDPIGLGAGPNLYGYVGSAPTYFIDPLGLDEIKITPGGSVYLVCDSGDTPWYMGYVPMEAGWFRSIRRASDKVRISYGPGTVPLEEIRQWAESRAGSAVEVSYGEVEVNPRSNPRSIDEDTAMFERCLKESRLQNDVFAAKAGAALVAIGYLLEKATILAIEEVLLNTATGGTGFVIKGACNVGRRGITIVLSRTGKNGVEEVIEVVVRDRRNVDEAVNAVNEALSNYADDATRCVGRSTDIIGAPILARANKNYRKLYLKADPNLPGGWHVHHTIPQKYREIFADIGIDIDDIQFLRGVDPKIHSKITAEWARFDKLHGGAPHTGHVSDFLKVIDDRYRDYLRVPGF